MPKEAYVTLVATDSYGSGALVLGHRLRDLGTQKELVCLVTNNVSRSVIDHLSQLYQVVSVETLYSNDHDNLELLGRPDLDITFTKIHVWKLAQYKKIVFLDADTLPLKNVDELFERPHFSAAPDAGWPDCFNSGVFVTEPSDTDYQALKKMATENGSFDGGDQGLLNKYFSSWSTSPSDHRLPFTYNMTPTSQYTYAPAHQYYGNNVSICHFIGLNKPWKYQRFSDGSVFSHHWKGYTDLLQSWWDTWNLHYGQNEPNYLLSRSPNDIIFLSYHHQPIKQFHNFIDNAWDNINIHNYVEDNHHQRHVIPMPPIDKITIKHSDWMDSMPGHNYDETSQCSSHHTDEGNSEYFELEKKYISNTNKHVQNNNHQNNHETNTDSHNNYRMINWNPACESPPNYGMSANIPDLSQYDNAWDKPFDFNSVWIAPEPQPIPKFDFNYDFVHERQQIEHKEHYHHEDQYKHQYDQHHHDQHHHDQHHHDQHHHDQHNQYHQHEHDNHHYEHHYHQEEHHHEEAKSNEQQYFAFPWEYKHEPVPTPTRIWLDELDQMVSQNETGINADNKNTVDGYSQDDESNHIQVQHEQNSYNNNYGTNLNVSNQGDNNTVNYDLDKMIKEINQSTVEKNNQSSIKEINNDQCSSQYNDDSVATTFNVQVNDITSNVDNFEDEYYLEMDESDSNSITYVMDTISYESIMKSLNRSRKLIVDDDETRKKYAYTLHDNDDDDDRQLIPIPFKSTSKLNSRAVSPAQTPIGSRRSSISKSRRSSISSQKSQPSNVKSPISTKLLISHHIAKNKSNNSDIYSQPSQMQPTFVKSNHHYPKKTPYTSAATTPTKEYFSFNYDTDELITYSNSSEIKEKVTSSRELIVDTTGSKMEHTQMVDDHQIIEENDKEKKMIKEEEDNIDNDEKDDLIYYNQYSIGKSLKNTYNQHKHKKQQHRKNNYKWNPELALDLLRAQSNYIISSNKYRNTVEDLNTSENKQDDSSSSEITEYNVTNNIGKDDTDKVDDNGIDENYNNTNDDKVTNKKEYTWGSIIIPSSSSKILTNDMDKDDYLSYKSIAIDETQSVGTTSPVTPIVRTLKDSLTAEIEAAKEQHLQQRAALALVQPKTAIATVLEAELDLTKSGLFNRRSCSNYDFINSINDDNGTFNTSKKNIFKNKYSNDQYDITPNNDGVINDKINTDISQQSGGYSEDNVSHFGLGKNVFESSATSTQINELNSQKWNDDVNSLIKQDKLEIGKDNIDEEDDDGIVKYKTYFDSDIINVSKNKMKELVVECTTSTISRSSSSSSIFNNQNNLETSFGESSQSTKNASLQNLSRYNFSETLYGLPNQQYHPLITMKNIRSGPPSPSNISTLSLGSLASNNQSKISTQESDLCINSDDESESINNNYHHVQPTITLSSSSSSPSINSLDVNDNYQVSNETIQSMLQQVIETECISLQSSPTHSTASEAPDSQIDLNRKSLISSESLPLEASSSILEVGDNNENKNNENNSNDGEDNNDESKDKMILKESYEIATSVTTNVNTIVNPAKSTQSLSIIEKNSDGDLYRDKRNISTWLSLTTSDDSLLSIEDELLTDRHNNSNNNKSDNNNNGNYYYEEDDKNHTHIFEGTNTDNDDDDDKKMKSKLLSLAKTSPLLAPISSISRRKDLQRVIQSDYEARSQTPSSSISSISSLPPATTTASVTDDGETIYLSAVEDISDVASNDWRSAASATPIIDNQNDIDEDIHDHDNNYNEQFDLNHHLMTIENDMINVTSSTITVTKAIINATTTTTITTTNITNNTITETTNSPVESSSLESDHTFT